MIEESIGANNNTTSKCHVLKTNSAAARLINENTDATDPTELGYSGNKVDHSP
jgi:hypothetical protein